MRAVLLLLLASLAACQSRVLHDLDEERANLAASALEAAGIDAQKSRGQDGNFSLDVPSPEEGRALNVLHNARFLSSEPAPPELGLLASPAAEEEARRLRLAARLARDLETFPGIVEARVEVSPGPRPVLGESVPAPSASVVYRYQGEAPDEAKLREWLSAALGGVPVGKLSLVGVPLVVPDPPDPFAYVGPFAVAPGSARPLWLALASGAALLLALAAFSGALYLRLRRTS
jgi:type III secretory pathway lipoprotein EscJ